MAGAVEVPGDIVVKGFTDDNPNKLAEWNVHIDPKAAKTVFDNGVPPTPVPLDTTNNVPPRKPFVEEMKAGGDTPWGRFLVRVYERLLVGNSTGEYYRWDPLAAAVASKPELCGKTERRKLTVSAKRGSAPPPGVAVEPFPLTNAWNRPREPLDAATEGAVTAKGAKAEVSVCLAVEPSAFEKRFTSVLAVKK